MTGPRHVATGAPARPWSAGRASFAVIAVAVIAGRAAASLPPGDLRVGASNAIQVGAAAMATVYAARRARRATGRSRRHLSHLALASGSWALGQLYWTAAQVLVSTGVPFPSPADIGFMLVFPPAVAAMVVAPSSRLHGASSRRRILDAVAIACAVLFVAWTTLLYPVLEDTYGAGLLTGTVSLAYITGDLVVLAVLGVVFADARRAWRVPLAIYALAFGCLFLADAGFASLSVDGSYATGSWVDLGWTVGWSLLAVGARGAPLTDAGEDGAPAFQGRAAALVPGLAFGVVAIGALLQEVKREPLIEHPLLVVIVITLFSAVALRSAAARGEGEAYTRQLAEAAEALRRVRLGHEIALEAAAMSAWCWTAGDNRWRAAPDVSARLPIGSGGLDLAGDDFMTAVAPADRAAVSAALAATSPDRPVYDFEFALGGHGGEPVHLRTRGRAEYDLDGRLVGRAGVVFDVTESRRAREGLRRRDANIAALAALGARAQRAPSVAVAVEDAVATLGTMLDAGLCQVWRIDPATTTAHRLATWPGADHGPDLLSIGPDVVDARGVPHDGDVAFDITCLGTRWGALSVRPPGSHPMSTEATALAGEVANIVTSTVERSEAEIALWREARYDALTALPNRVLLAERLTAALGGDGGPLLAVAYLDLDDFKAVNDRFGHPVGDALLIAVARRLKASVRPNDVVARLGGDEFAVLFSDLAGVSSVAPLVARLQDGLAGPVDLGETIVHPRASIGFTTTADGERSVTGLLRNADLAMYASKKKGKGRSVAFEARFHEDAVRAGRLADDIRGALARDELLLHYQPFVDLRSGRLCGAEALIRWDRVGEGIEPPDAFLPTAGRLGLLEGISEFVVAEACAWASELVATAGAEPFMVAVNIAPSDLLSVRLVDAVARALAATGLEPHRLCLEITESGVLSDVPAAAAALNALRSTGVRIAIDDFGTGYSSMRQLKALPVDIVKIDRGFVDGLGTEMDDSAFVAAIINMAHTLGLDVVAEGVETSKQYDALAELGCEMAQGYLFGLPGPPGTLLAAGEERAVPPMSVSGCAQLGEAAHPKTVLVADDLEDDRRLLARQLSRSGHFTVVGEAGDGSSAVRMVGRLRPDIVLLDMSMPVLDGLGALARIRAESPETAVVMLSGYASDDVARAALAAGAKACLAKGPANVAAALETLFFSPQEPENDRRR